MNEEFYTLVNKVCSNGQPLELLRARKLINHIRNLLDYQWSR